MNNEKEKPEDYHNDIDGFEEDENNQEPDYYDCYSCGTSTGERQMGNMCPNCGAYMQEEWF